MLTPPPIQLDSRPNQELQTVAFFALGCRANQLESSVLADEFRSNGWQIVPFEQAASLYVINTCTVTHGGDSESRRIIRRAVKTNPEARVAVTGCYAQMAPDEIADIAGVTYVIGNNFKQDVYRITQQIFPPQAKPFILVDDFEKSRILEGGSSLGVNRTRAALKVQDGCDYRCTYCIIPFARGPSRCPSISNLQAGLKQLVEAGHHEIVLTGINIGQYEDPETGGNYADMLRALVDVPGDFRLRPSSIDPNDVTPEVIAIMANTPKVCPYFHLSMQSAEDYLLKRMGRRHRVADLFETCGRILEKIPGACIGTDIIVGFPGETDERIETVCQNLAALPLAYFHTFSYSQRKGTAAADFPEQVGSHQKKERSTRLIALSQEKSYAYRQSWLNRTVQVVVEKDGRGTSENYIQIDLDQPDAPQNKPVPVTITSVTQECTKGVIIP